MFVEYRSLSPFQLQANWFILDYCPFQFETEGKMCRHYIFCPQSGLEVPLVIYGVISYLTVRTPSHEYLNSCADIELIGADVTWDPNNDDHEKEELNIDANQYGLRHRHRISINVSG